MTKKEATRAVSPLLLRPYRRDDLIAQTALFGDPEVMRFVGDGKPVPAADGGRLFARIFEVYASDPTFHIWAVDIAGAYAGHAELKRRAGHADYEIIYLLARPYWGKGYGSRVASDVLAFGFDRSELSHIIATVYEANTVSRRLLEALGFRPDERVSREYDALGYLLTAETYRRRAASK